MHNYPIPKYTCRIPDFLILFSSLLYHYAWTLVSCDKTWWNNKEIVWVFSIANNIRVPKDQEHYVEKLCKIFQKHPNGKGKSFFSCKNVFLFWSNFLGRMEMNLHLKTKGKLIDFNFFYGGGGYLRHAYLWRRRRMEIAFSIRFLKIFKIKS